jgi:hypothetical protein
MLIASVLLAAAPVGEAFDLLCVTTAISQRNAGQLPENVPLTKPSAERPMDRLRVDLAAGRWCKDDCTYTSPLTFDENHIVLEWAGEPDVRDSLNRINGRRVMILPGTDRTFAFVSDCRPATFSGFPAKRF